MQRHLSERVKRVAELMRQVLHPFAERGPPLVDSAAGPVSDNHLPLGQGCTAEPKGGKRSSLVLTCGRKKEKQTFQSPVIVVCVLVDIQTGGFSDGLRIRFQGLGFRV